MDNETSVKWTCNLRSDFTENIIEYDKNHNPYIGFKIRCAYRDGVYVKKSKVKFKEYINQISEYFMNCTEENPVVAQVLFELGSIRKDEKRAEESKNALEKARSIMFRQLLVDLSSDNLEWIKRINGMYYSVSGDTPKYNLFDIYYLLRKNSKLILQVNDIKISVNYAEGKINANGEQFDSVDRFVSEYMLEGKLITNYADSIIIECIND